MVVVVVDGAVVDEVLLERRTTLGKGWRQAVVGAEAFATLSTVLGSEARGATEWEKVSVNSKSLSTAQGAESVTVLSSSPASSSTARDSNSGCDLHCTSTSSSAIEKARSLLTGTRRSSFSSDDGLGGISSNRLGSKICAKKDGLLRWPSRETGDKGYLKVSSATKTAVASADIDLLPRKRSAFKAGGGGGGTEQVATIESASGVPTSEANSMMTLSEIKASEYNSGADMERVNGFRSPSSEAAAEEAVIDLQSSMATRGEENRSGSSSIVLRSEFLRPARLFSELDVESGPKRHVTQDKGRSLVAISEMRECFTISGNSNIVSKICSLRAAVNCEADATAGEE